MSLGHRRLTVLVAATVVGVALMIWLDPDHWWIPLLFIPFGFLASKAERWLMARVRRTDRSSDRRP